MPFDGKAFGEEIVEIVKGYVAREFERRGCMVYKGVYGEDIQYRRGDVVSRQGSLWYCTSTTRGIPGRDVDWKMISKSGSTP